MRRITLVAASLAMLGSMSTSLFAASDSVEVKKLAKQLAELQQEVTQLQAELKSKQSGKIAEPAVIPVNSHHIQKAAPRKIVKSPNISSSSSNEKPAASVDGAAAMPTRGASYLPVDVDVPGQSFVSSGPYIGVQLQYSGSELIINAPSVNQDVSLLKVRKNIHERLQQLGVIEEPDHAHVLLSGVVEGEAIYKNIGGGPDSTDIDITNTTLDAYVLGPSMWLSSLISITYDNNQGTESGSLDNGARGLNSRLFLNQAFITVGNLSRTPFYGTIGQLYIPFGTYSTNMVSSPLTQLLARTKARAIVLGDQPQRDNTLYSAVYAFQGDTHAGATSRVNNGGINLGYRFKQSNWRGDFGGGYMLNIADSVGMQFVSNNENIFNGFGGVNGTGNERIAHRVPAYDVRGLFAIGDHVNLLGEYIFAATHFSMSDLTMNYHGAAPQALNSEAAYTFNAFDRPTSIVAGYAMTKDALALQLPAQRYSLVLNTSIWKDTIQSLEFRRDMNYGASNIASGSGVPAPQASGRPDYAITAQFDVYF